MSTTRTILTTLIVALTISAWLTFTILSLINVVT